jgi:hypothetical protein
MLQNLTEHLVPFENVGSDIQIAMWVLAGLCLACTIFYIAGVIRL